MTTTTIAYPFVRSELNDAELECSILSFMKFFEGGDLDFLVVGEEPRFQLPSWARFVPHDRVRDAKGYPVPLEDAIQKIDVINSNVNSEEWIFAHDDMFALETFRIEDLTSQVLYTHLRNIMEEWPQADVQKWASVKRETGFLLGLRDMFDTATHFPRVFNRQKVKATLGWGAYAGKLWDFQIAYDQLFLG